METNKTIVIKDLKKNFGTRCAVKGLSLEIAEGELFALLGVNGAGKTTTIRMLSCLSRPTSGEAWIEGQSILSDADKIKQSIALSMQETAVATGLTVRENLELMARLNGSDKTEARKLADHMIAEFGLAEYEKNLARTLSGGWQRRLSIAMALITNPRVLFLDEPTLGLDVLARRELWEMIRRLKGKITVILTTHYLEEAEALSDRIGIMVSGDLVALGTAEELKNRTGKDSFEDAFIAFVKEEVK